ncbi:MAG: ABC transporter ATP-binding protein [Acidobacteria bacterium]|nr:ABC transporter ATP-binding protein [Acidobacteriota bacterium]MCA1610665.1 ABC transporter ATP-binding protein [Acidobacteriota bacterium]
MSARVEVRRLSKAYGRVPALDRVSLSLEPGSTTALVGASGSGKTTLLRCLAGLLAPDAGEILFDGRDVAGVPAERRGVGVVFQSYALFPHLTVADNLAFGLDVRRTSSGDRARRVAQLAEELGLEPLLDRRPGQISGGERQRVALGRALAYRPVLLLLDEPLAALDPNLAESVREALARAIAAERTTVLIVTHDRADALRLGDRVVLLRAGRVEQEGAPRDLYRYPKTEYAASFFGSGALWEVEARVEGSGIVAETPVGRIALPGARPGRLRLIVRPEALSVRASAGTSVTVRGVSYEGDRSRIVFTAGGRDAVVFGPAGLEVAPGDRIGITVDPRFLVVLPEAEAAPSRAASRSQTA